MSIAPQPAAFTMIASIDVRCQERLAVLGSKFPRGLLVGGVVVQSPAANLGARDQDIAAVPLQYPRRRIIGLGKKSVGGATGEQRHARPARPLGGQHLGQPAVMPL